MTIMIKLAKKKKKKIKYTWIYIVSKTINKNIILIESFSYVKENMIMEYYFGSKMY